MKDEQKKKGEPSENDDNNEDNDGGFGDLYRNRVAEAHDEADDF